VEGVKGVCFIFTYYVGSETKLKHHAEALTPENKIKEYLVAARLRAAGLFAASVLLRAVAEGLSVDGSRVSSRRSGGRVVVDEALLDVLGEGDEGFLHVDGIFR